MRHFSLSCFSLIHLQVSSCGWPFDAWLYNITKIRPQLSRLFVNLVVPTRGLSLLRALLFSMCEMLWHRKHRFPQELNLLKKNMVMPWKYLLKIGKNLFSDNTAYQKHCFISWIIFPCANTCMAPGIYFQYFHTCLSEYLIIWTTTFNLKKMITLKIIQISFYKQSGDTGSQL